MKKRYLTGMRITNDFHIGNYLGVIPTIKSISKYNDSIFMFVADLHSLTNGSVQNNPYDLIKFWMSSLNEVTNITYYIQSEFYEFAQMSWILTCNTPFGELQRMTQFKDQQSKGNSVNSGYLIYPMLMSADIILPRATHVPVGPDQAQHVEMVRDTARMMNNKYNLNLVVPELFIHEAVKILDLKDTSKKMSKSNYSPNTTIFLADSQNDITNKIKRAVTDSEMMPNNIDSIKDTRLGVYNLCQIYKGFSETSFQNIENEFAGKRISVFKEALIELLIDKLSKIQHFTNQTSNMDVRKVLDQHKPIVQSAIDETMQKVNDIFVGYKKYL